LAREIAAASQHADGILFSEMMKRERAKDDIVAIRRSPFENVCLDEGNFRMITTQLSRDFECGWLAIQCIDLDRRADFSRNIDNQSRNVARAGGKIDNAHVTARFNPAMQKMQKKAMAAEEPI